MLMWPSITRRGGTLLSVVELSKKIVNRCIYLIYININKLAKYLSIIFQYTVTKLLHRAGLVRC